MMFLSAARIHMHSAYNGLVCRLGKGKQDVAYLERQLSMHVRGEI